jgi:hypothetical protein
MINLSARESLIINSYSDLIASGVCKASEKIKSNLFLYFFLKFVGVVNI